MKPHDPVRRMQRVATVFCAVGALVAMLACEDKPMPTPAKTDTTPVAKKSAAAKSSGGPTTTAAAKSTSAATAAASGSAAPADSKPTYREVPHEEWVKVVGPKLPAGAVVAHKVFEGWPKEKALFVITKEDNKFFARVFADGRTYKAGPLAKASLEALRINAVAFFDADDNGKIDVAVIARYKEGDKEPPTNSLLAWTGTSIERMKQLEPKISSLDTMAKVKKELGVK